MRKWMTAMLTAVTIMAYAPGMASAQEMARQPKSQFTMRDITMMINKLKNMMMSMRDFDELERSGVPHSDVERMRSAMRVKINRLIEHIVQSIHQLR